MAFAFLLSNSVVDYFSCALTDKATKFSLVGRPPAVLPEAHSLAETMELVVRTIAVLVLTLPESRGRALRDDIRRTSIDIIKGKRNVKVDLK